MASSLARTPLTDLRSVLSLAPNIAMKVPERVALPFFSRVRASASTSAIPFPA
jgi:hypothetical protein